ncbi:MAG: threonine/serine exporter ThrE family protein [Labedaea sp.]
MLSDPGQLHRFLLEIGRALSLAGTAVSETQERLSRIAAANGAEDARIVVLPTALMISVREAHETTIDAIPQASGALRLDQISVLYEVVKGAERGELDLVDGLAQLHAIRTMSPRYGPIVTVLGYSAMIAGLCLILRPTPLDVVISTIFGAFVGTLVLLCRGRPTLRVLVPIIAAVIVSALTFEAVQHDILDPGLRTLIAPLVTFLPGGVLTTATVELATGEMVAGASRLVFGFLQLLLLAFGIVAGAELAGLPRNIVLQDTYTMVLGPWAPWLGVLIFGVAVSFYFSAPRGSLLWLLLVLLTAWVGQLVGEALVGANTSGFFGAIAMTPVALAVAEVPGGPPSQVTFLPAFWLLVPGALGLVGVTQILGDPAIAGAGDLLQPLVAIVAIALGVLCGTSIYRGIALAVQRRPGRRR